MESGGRSAMNFSVANVTRPVAPTITLNVRRRDSHQRKMLVVLRTSAGAGKRRRVRADTRCSDAVDDGNIHPSVIHRYFAVELAELSDDFPGILWARARPPANTAHGELITLIHAPLFAVVAMLHVRRRVPSPHSPSRSFYLMDAPGTSRGFRRDVKLERCRHPAIA
jgi:hypothetical protein